VVFDRVNGKCDDEARTDHAQKRVLSIIFPRDEIHPTDVGNDNSFAVEGLRTVNALLVLGDLAVMRRVLAGTVAYQPWALAGHLV
jgi:hypothetical protein